MFLHDYSLDITIYDEEGEEYKSTGNACFRPVKGFNKDISKIYVKVDAQKSRFTTAVNERSFFLLKDWLAVGATYRTRDSFIINEGTQPKSYYFNLCVYFRLSFEWLYMPTIFTYQAVFGKEFDHQKLLITQAFQDYVGLYCGNHGITNGTIYLHDKFTPKELKERFQTRGIYSSWQDTTKEKFDFRKAYDKHKTLIGVYEQFIEDLHTE